MSFPTEIQSLANQYGRGQMSVCDLFSSTVREASMTQYCHLQGEVNAIAKLDKHYHGLFGFLAVKDGDIWEKSPHLHRPCLSKGQYGGCMQTFQNFFPI